MNDKVLEILEYGSEGYLVDFKIEQYVLGKNFNKHEFLKDISAFANHPMNEDKFIIIGVEEKNGMADSFNHIRDLTDQAKYQQFLNEYIEPQINFEYRPISYEEFQLAYFRIFNNRERPYLFKKEFEIIKKDNKVEKNNSNKIVYRKGDGFIRTGSGTRKMFRPDFEKIYNDKLKQKDRKSDLIITSTINDFKELPPFEEVKFKILDIDIQNLSNKSIDVDVELKIYKNDYCKIITNTEFERIINEQSSNHSSYTNVFLPNFDFENEEKEEYFIFRRTKRQNMKTAVSIAQLYTEKEVYGNEILIIFNESCKVCFEVTIRSDDFSEGALNQRFEVNF